MRRYKSTFIQLVDGGWGEFTEWGECPVSCGGGQHSRTRVCDNPAPEFGGLDCTNDGSSDIETEDCNTQECPSKFSKYLNMYCFK